MIFITVGKIAFLTELTVVHLILTNTNINGIIGEEIKVNKSLQKKLAYVRIENFHPIYGFLGPHIING